MTELKTLKDLKDTLSSHIIEQREFLASAEFVSAKELKAEAIKWVKAGEDEYRISRREINAINNFIMEFFNLTEEDLK